MIKKIAFWVAVVVAVGGPGYFLVSRCLTTEADRVRSVIDSLVSNLESENVGWALLRIRGHLSESYKHHGESTSITIDKAVALRFIGRLKQRFKNFNGHTRELRVSVSGETARADITGRITAAKTDKPQERVEVMTEPGLNRAIIDFAKEEGDWVVTGSERVSYKLAEYPQSSGR